MNNSNIMQPDETKPVKKEYAFVRKIKTRKLQRKMKFKLLFVAGVVVIAFVLLSLRRYLRTSDIRTQQFLLREGT